MSSPAPTPAPARVAVRPGSLEAWQIAVRTRTLWIATVPVFVGTSLAYLSSGRVDVLFASLALVASILLQAIANLQNDVGYTARGGETGTRVGLPRATSSGLLTPREVRLAIVLAVAATILIGLPLVARWGIPVLVMGLASVAAALGYMGGPRPIAYTPLGELLVFIFFGLIAVAGSGYIQLGVVTAAMLVAGAALVQRPSPLTTGLLVAVTALSVTANFGDRQRADTAYADYAVESVQREGMLSPRAFVVNNQHASVIDSSEPPQYARYVQHLRRILLEDLRFSDRDILVLGAGGFTLSHREPLNRYTYVDIDPAIRTIAERDFLREPIRGEFVATDARRFVVDTTRRFDAIVVDVYSSRTSIPGHLVTREFWRDTRHALKPDGVMLANLILDGRLASPYARNLLATIESAYGRCAVEVLNKSAPLSNVIVTCFTGGDSEATRVYVDERNLADIDSSRSP